MYRFADVHTAHGVVKFHYVISTPDDPNAPAIDPRLPTVLLLNAVYSPLFTLHPQFVSEELRRFNLVSVDHLAHGLTEGRVPPDYGQRQAAEDIAAFMDVIHLPPCIIWGLSLGTIIALQLAIARPEKVTGLFLISPLGNKDSAFGNRSAAPEMMRTPRFSGGASSRAEVRSVTNRRPQTLKRRFVRLRFLGLGSRGPLQNRHRRFAAPPPLLPLPITAMADSDSNTSSSDSEQDKKKKKKKKSTAEKCKWLSAQSAAMLDVLKEQKAQGQQSESGWKETVWTACAEALQEEFPDAPGAVKTAAKCQDHFTNLKGDYKVVKELRARSGLGWDEAGCMVTASPDVWDKTCKANKKFKKFRKKAFPLYDALADLIGDVVATGEGALVLSTPAVKKPDTKPPKSKAEKEENEELKKRRRSSTGSEPIEIETSDDNITRSTGASKRQKTATGGRKPSGASAVHGVAGSLDNLSNTLADVLGNKSAEAAESRVAKRRSEAVILVSNMTDLPIAQRAGAIRLFADQLNVDLLLEIPVDELRVAFVQELLSAEDRRLGTSRTS